MIVQRHISKGEESRCQDVPRNSGSLHEPRRKMRGRWQRKREFEFQTNMPSQRRSTRIECLRYEGGRIPGMIERNIAVQFTTARETSERQEQELVDGGIYRAQPWHSFLLFLPLLSCSLVRPGDLNLFANRKLTSQHVEDDQSITGAESGMEFWGKSCVVFPLRIH